MHKFDENCYIGSRDDALNAAKLKDSKITHILTLESHALPCCEENKYFRMKFVHVYDLATEDILSHLDDCLEFIRTAIKEENGSVLVHCFHGVSRSATVAVAYLMKKHKLPVADALIRLKDKRPSIHPNSGFLNQLVLFEKLGFELNHAHVPAKLYRLQAAFNYFEKYHTFHLYSTVIHPDPVNSPQSGPVLRCRQCRRTLASKSNLISHCSKETPDWSDSNWVDATMNADSAALCKLAYFVEPIAWMTYPHFEMQGKLHCPKCSAKIGAYNWLQGCKCACAARIVPGFYLQVSRVDLL